MPDNTVRALSATRMGQLFVRCGDGKHFLDGQLLTTATRWSDSKPSPTEGFPS
jgi:hypothetical protein